MSELNLTVFENDDPTIGLILYDKAADETLTAVSLTGKTVEVYIKTAPVIADDHESVIKYTKAEGGASTTTGTGSVVITDAAAGTVQILATDADLDGPRKLYYRVCVIASSRRQTYAHGTLTLQDV